MKEVDIKIDATIKHLKQHYWLNIIFLVIFFLLAMFKVFPVFAEKQPINVTLERYIIVLTIIVIPASLKMFANLLKKVAPATDAQQAIRKYKSASYIRLYSLSSVTLLNIILYDYSGNMNFFWFTVVLLIMFIFCRPSFPELEKLIKPQSSLEENNNLEQGLIEVEQENTNSDEENA